MDTVTIAYIGVFVGVLMRTLLPYARKLKEAEGDNKQLAFDIKYVGTAIFAVIVSFITATLIFPTFTIPEDLLGYIFITAFGFGYASNDIINEVIA